MFREELNSNEISPEPSELDSMLEEIVERKENEAAEKENLMVKSSGEWKLIEWQQMTLGDRQWKHSPRHRKENLQKVTNVQRRRDKEMRIK